MIVRLFILAAVLISSCGTTWAQDFIRLGVSHDFRQQKLVQTFSFDFNRTEAVKEKVDKTLLRTKSNFYLTPTSDVNLGDGVTSSENNVLVQLNTGWAFYGKKHKSQDSTWTGVINRAFEINPSYNADKLFNEKLYYGQIDYLFNLFAQRVIITPATGSNSNTPYPDTFVKTVHSLSLGPVATLGGRHSTIYDDALYSTAGVLLGYKTRLLDSDNNSKWIFKATGTYYYLLSENRELTTDKYAGILKTSIDRLILSGPSTLPAKVLIGIAYKYGNDNPKYTYVHTFDLSLKLNFLPATSTKP
jgi:hypothetical protein